MKPHILVIDDQISLPRFIAMELHSEGYRVSINCSGVAAPSAIRELNPDLIVLNWELRCTSGADVYEQLRSGSHSVPVVVITAKDESSCHLALELGVQTCLTKPFSMDDLLNAIETHLQREVYREPTNKYYECCGHC